MSKYKQTFAHNFTNTWSFSILCTEICVACMQTNVAEISGNK